MFIPAETDRQVDAIHAETKAMLEDTSRTAMRHKKLLDKNGFTLRIYIATGGDHRGN
jgi:hypothetical protein